MNLRIFVVCSECRRQREVVVEGSSGAVEVEHDCDAQSAFVVRVAAQGSGAQLTMAA